EPDIRLTPYALRLTLSRRFLLVLHYLVFRIHHVAIVGLGTARFVLGRGLLGALALRLLLRVHLLRQLVRRLRQGLGSGLDRVLVAALDRFFRRLDRRLDAGFLVRRDLVAVLGEGFLHRVDERVALIACFHQLAGLAILVRM